MNSEIFVRAVQRKKFEAPVDVKFKNLSYKLDDIACNGAEFFHHLEVSPY